MTPQGDLKSIEEYAATWAKVKLSDPKVVRVTLLLYSMSMQAPSAEDAKKWADHFKMDRKKNQIVLAGEAWMLGDAAYNMIPGFHLVDADFKLVSDSSGHNPKDDLYKTLLPMLGKLVKEGK